MAATIATMTATNRKIGLARMVAPNETNAPPTDLIVPISPPNALPISVGLILPNVLENTAAFSDAPSKSRLIKSPLMAPKLLDTASNLEPVVKTATCSLASLSWSFNSPARCAKRVISSGSVASAICPLRSLSSALMAPMPPSFNGISTSFMLWPVISYLKSGVD